MGNIRIAIGNRSYELHCGDEEELHLQTLARLVDEKAGQARQIVGELNEARQLLFAALFLADELVSARQTAAVAADAADRTPPPTELEALERIATQLERLAEAL